MLRSLADFERCGIAPYLGTAGLDHHARELGDVEYKLVAIGERFEPLADRSPSIGRLLGDAGLRLYVIRSGTESYADRCRPPAPLWRIPPPMR